jgi:prepilin-type N-terminal cleavage/methylation domain-containing protein
MTHAPQDSRAEAGFTLVEALVAMVILAFGLIAVSNLLLVATGSNGIANNMTASATVASGRMEQIKALPFVQLVPGGDVAADVAGYFADDLVPGVGTIHTRWQVVAIDADTVVVKVRSEGITNLARSIARSEFTTVRVCDNKLLGCP